MQLHNENIAVFLDKNKVCKRDRDHPKAINLLGRDSKEN